MTQHNIVRNSPTSILRHTIGNAIRLLGRWLLFSVGVLVIFFGTGLALMALRPALVDGMGADSFRWILGAWLLAVAGLVLLWAETLGLRR